MKAIFLSDAHLRFLQDDNYRLLLNLLENQKDLDALFLLGDIFEFWLGYEHLVFAAYVPLLEQLRKLSESGTQLYFVEGNHDFELGPYFSNTLNCTIITEQRTIKWDGHNITLCHGDLIKPSRSYQRLRKLWRSWPIKALARVIHPDQVWTFGIWLSNKSQRNRPQNKQQDPTRWLVDYSISSAAGDCDLMICGHFHFPVNITDQKPQVIALGDWQTRFSYAEILDGKITIKTHSEEADSGATLTPAR